MYWVVTIIYWLLGFVMAYNLVKLDSITEQLLGVFIGALVMFLCQADTYRTLNNLNTKKSQSEEIL